MKISDLIATGHLPKEWEEIPVHKFLKFLYRYGELNGNECVNIDVDANKKSVDTILYFYSKDEIKKKDDQIKEYLSNAPSLSKDTEELAFNLLDSQSILAVNPLFMDLASMGLKRYTEILNVHIISDILMFNKDPQSLRKNWNDYFSPLPYGFSILGIEGKKDSLDTVVIIGKVEGGGTPVGS